MLEDSYPYLLESHGIINFGPFGIVILYPTPLVSKFHIYNLVNALNNVWCLYHFPKLVDEVILTQKIMGEYIILQEVNLIVRRTVAARKDKSVILPF